MLFLSSIQEEDGVAKGDAMGRELLSNAKPFALSFPLAAFESVISYDNMPLTNYCRLGCKFT
jgi:hypothetical protein